MIVIKSYKRWIIVCFISILLICSFHCIISKKIEFVAYSNGNLRIQDYAYHIIIVKSFWLDSFGNIYKPYFQQQALSAYVGSPIYTVMPLGITPIALVVWLPFAYISRFSMALSYTLWIAFSVSVLLIALWNIGRCVFQRENQAILPITLSLVTVLSATTLFAIILGQTSLLAAGLFIHLIYLLYKRDDQWPRNNLMILLISIFVLGMKPTYIAMGLGLLIIYGLWGKTFYSIIIVLAFLLGITPLLTLEWVPSYLNLLEMYSHGNFPDFYAWAIVPETMNIFRSAFRNIIGDNLTGLISTIVTCCIYISVVGSSIFTRIRSKSTDHYSPIRITKEQLFIMLVASYLLFAPYAGAYEDLMLLPVFILVLLGGNTPPLTNYKSLAIVFFLFPILFHNIFSLDKPLWLFWILKTLIIGYMLYFCRFQRNEIVEHP